jgi:hypothetical protein
VEGRVTTGLGVRAEETHRSADESLLFDWARHYGALIVLSTIVGLFGGLGASTLLRVSEASTLIVDRSGTVTSRELGSVAEAVFRSDAAVSPAMEALGIDSTPERFLEENVELRPVPDSRILIVVGRGPNARRAEATSSAMSQSLITALAAAGLEGFTILSAGTSPGSLSRVTATALGGLVGLWFGLGTAIVWYRIRRPVLSLRRALDIHSSAHVTILDGRASWSGALRRTSRPRKRGRNEQTLAHLIGSEGVPAIVVPGSSRRAKEAVTRRLDRASRATLGSGFSRSSATASRRLARRAIGTRSVATRTAPGTLLVVDAGTPERDLALEASMRQQEELRMLWVR